MSERNTRCPVLGCGRWSNRCSGRPRPLPPDFSLQLDSSIDAVVNSHVCAACYVRHTRRLARGPKDTPSSYAAPHGPPRCAGHGGHRPTTRVVLSTFFPSSPSPSLRTSCSFVLDVLSHPAAVHLPSSTFPLSLSSSLPAARRALALSQTTLHNINPAGPPCPTACTPDHAHHIVSGPRSSLLSSHHPQPQHEARTSDASGSDALRLYFGCRPVAPRLYRGCGWLYPTTRWL